MRTVTMTLIAALAALVLLGACGDDEAAQRGQKLEELKKELKAHRLKYTELQPGWQEIRNKVIPVNQAYKRAKGTPEEAAAKAARDAAAAESQKTHDAETAWRQRENELVDEIARLGG